MIVAEKNSDNLARGKARLSLSLLVALLSSVSAFSAGSSARRNTVLDCAKSLGHVTTLRQYNANPAMDWLARVTDIIRKISGDPYAELIGNGGENGAFLATNRSGQVRIYLVPLSEHQVERANEVYPHERRLARLAPAGTTPDIIEIHSERVGAYRVPIMEMEFVDVTTPSRDRMLVRPLDEIIHSEIRSSALEMTRVSLAILRRLSLWHNNSPRIFHGDLKPEHIIVIHHTDSDRYRVIFLDFAFGNEFGQLPAGICPGVICGTPRYMSEDAFIPRLTTERFEREGGYVDEYAFGQIAQSWAVGTANLDMRSFERYRRSIATLGLSPMYRLSVSPASVPLYRIHRNLPREEWQRTNERADYDIFSTLSFFPWANLTENIEAHERALDAIRAFSRGETTAIDRFYHQFYERNFRPLVRHSRPTATQLYNNSIELREHFTRLGINPFL